MSYGLITYRADTSVILDGLTQGGVLRDIIFIPRNSQSSKTYGDVSATSDVSWVVARGGGPDISTSLAAGGVKLSWAYNLTTPQSDTTIFVFTSNRISDDPFGVEIYNDNNQLLADQGYPSPQYVGKLSLNSTPDTAYRTPDGYTAIVHSTVASDLRSGANKIVLLAMPDVGTDDTWFCLKKDFILASEGSVAVSIVVYTKAANYNLPTVHIYALDQPYASADPYALRLYDQTGQLTFDSGSECLSGRAALYIGYPSYNGGTATYTLGFSGTPGVSIPYYYYGEQSSSDNTKANRYAGVMRRVGNQLTTKTIFDVQVSSSSSSTNDAVLSGAQSLRYCTTADVSALSPRYTLVTTTTNLAAAPSITSQPANIIGSGNQTLSVTASGSTPLTYQWYNSSGPIAGATASAYNLTVSTSDNGTVYYCIVTNSIGSVRTRDAKVYYDTTSGPTITNVSYPSGNVAMNSTQTVSMTASGSPTPTCQLILNGSVVASGAGSASYNFTVTDSAGYSFNAHAIVDGTYVSHTTDRYFSVVVAQNDPVVITNFTGSTNVQAGNTATYTVTVSGHAPYYASWVKNGQAMGPPNDGFSTSTRSYSFTTTAADNGAQIYCMVSNYPVGEGFQYTATSSTITLTVGSATPSAPTPVFGTQPANKTVYGGSSATFTCSVSNYTSLQWYKNGVAISGATGTSVTVPTSTSDAGSSFTIQALATNAPAGYSPSSTWSSSATLTVNSSPPQNTYQSYNTISGSDDEYSANAYFDMYADGHYDGGAGIYDYWANGTGDGTLYDVYAGSSATPASGSFAFNTWYSFASFSGVGWAIAPSGATGNKITTTLSVKVRLRSTGAIVTTGSVTLSTQNGGVQQ